MINKLPLGLEWRIVADITLVLLIGVVTGLLLGNYLLNEETDYYYEKLITCENNLLHPSDALIGGDLFPKAVDENSVGDWLLINISEGDGEE